jgi:hypothetical protein
MRSDQHLKLTRREIARRQIETAIDLLFAGGDPVTINLIAWAAVDQLRGMLDHAGKQSLLGRLDERIRPEKLGRWYRSLKRHYNFAKHSDRDPEGVINDFRPEAALWAIYIAASDYIAAFGKMTVKMMVYRTWFEARYPHILLGEGQARAQRNADLLRDPGNPDLTVALKMSRDFLTMWHQDRPLLQSATPPEVLAMLEDA